MICDIQFSCDWPTVHGVPRCLLLIYIPAQAKTLPQAALALVNDDL